MDGAILSRSLPIKIKNRVSAMVRRKKIEAYGSPCLRMLGDDVRVFGEQLEVLCWAMVKLMHAARGVGLAAQQIGLTARICVIDTSCAWEEQKIVEWDGKDILGGEPQPIFPLFLINGEIIGHSKCMLCLPEGCLSAPGVSGHAIRHEWVIVRYQDDTGKSHVLRADGLLGQCVQHEIDHNNGIFFTDDCRLIPEDRDRIRPLLDKFAQ
jgi:peptide deformylase